MSTAEYVLIKPEGTAWTLWERPRGEGGMMGDRYRIVGGPGAWAIADTQECLRISLGDMGAWNFQTVDGDASETLQWPTRETAAQVIEKLEKEGNR